MSWVATLVGLPIRCIESESDDCCDIPGCTYEDAINFNPDSTIDDGSCEFLWGDMNQDGSLNIFDVITLVQQL